MTELKQHRHEHQLLGIGTSITDHGELIGLSDDDHLQYLTSGRAENEFYTKSQLQTSGQATINYGNLANVPSLIPESDPIWIAASVNYFTKTQINDTVSSINTTVSGHTGTASIHFTEASIDHTHIQNIGTNTHSGIDVHIANSTIHFTVASIDHGSISGLTDDDHTQYLTSGRADLRYLLSGSYVPVTVSDTSSIDFTLAGQQISAVVLPSGVHHGALSGLADDDHAQYALLAGRPGGQTLYGSTVSGESLLLLGSTQADGRVIAISTAVAPLESERIVCGSDANYAALCIRSSRIVNMGNGFGSGALFQIKDDAGVNNSIAAIYGLRNGADNTGDLGFFTYSAGSGTEKMRVMSNGNVGIGTTASLGRLHIIDTTADVVRGLILENNNTSAAGFHLNFWKNRSGGAVVNDDKIGNLISRAFDGTSYLPTTSIHTVVSGTVASGSVPCDMVFNAAADGTLAERMRLTSAGDFAIGAAPVSTYRFYVNQNKSTGYAGLFFNAGNNADRYGIIVQCGDSHNVGSAGTNVWIRLQDSDGHAQSYIQYTTTTPYAQFSATSDRRLKENIKETAICGLNVLNKIPLRQFDWKQIQGGHHIDIGYIAQEVEEIYPAMVSIGTDGMKTVGDGCLVSVLVKAVQELSEQNSELVKRLAALEEAVHVIQGMI